MSIQSSLLSLLQPRAFSEFRKPEPVRVPVAEKEAGFSNADGDSYEPSGMGLDSAAQQALAGLRQRDREVRSQEQAHVRAGGSLVSGPFYTFEEGPDGRNYAIDGTVVIDTAIETDPERTIAKMRRVQQAALAPVNPSPQDLRVAAEAARKEAVARAELRRAESNSVEAADFFAAGSDLQVASGTDRLEDAPARDAVTSTMLALRDLTRYAVAGPRRFADTYGRWINA